MTDLSLKKIVVADDDDAIADALRVILELEGYTVVLTKDGETITTVQSTQPDLVLLDIWMAGVDGRSICSEIKRNPETCTIPIILVSASRNAHLAAKDCLADGFIAKPFEMKELLDKVSKAIGVNKCVSSWDNDISLAT